MKFEELKFEGKEEKEIEWQAIEQSVENIKDKLGMGIDKNIKQTVVALKANGFGTTGSCEGHLDRALPYPWIDVESQLSEKLLNDHHYNELKEKARAARKGTAAMTETERKEYTNLVEVQIAEKMKKNINDSWVY
ncbi:MAG: hypothetical protein QMD50_03190 [Patescibacteria group bacterium]|nr:hypothetical protein [Patescibacteria group bacterium]